MVAQIEPHSWLQWQSHLRDPLEQTWWSIPSWLFDHRSCIGGGVACSKFMMMMMAMVNVYIHEMSMFIFHCFEQWANAVHRILSNQKTRGGRVRHMFIPPSPNGRPALSRIYYIIYKPSSLLVLVIPYPSLFLLQSFSFSDDAFIFKCIILHTSSCLYYHVFHFASWLFPLKNTMLGNKLYWPLSWCAIWGSHSTLLAPIPQRLECVRQWSHGSVVSRWQYGSSACHKKNDANVPFTALSFIGVIVQSQHRRHRLKSPMTKWMAMQVLLRNQPRRRCQASRRIKPASYRWGGFYGAL